MLIVYIIIVLIVILFLRMLYVSFRQKGPSLGVSPEGILLSQYEGPFNKKTELNDSLHEGWNIKTYKAKYENSRKPLLFKGSELANLYIENSLSNARAMGSGDVFGTPLLFDSIMFETKEGLFYNSWIPYTGLGKSRLNEIIKKLKETGFLNEPIFRIRESDSKSPTTPTIFISRERNNLRKNGDKK